MRKSDVDNNEMNDVNVCLSAGFLTSLLALATLLVATKAKFLERIVLLAALFRAALTVLLRSSLPLLVLDLPQSFGRAALANLLRRHCLDFRHHVLGNVLHVGLHTCWVQGLVVTQELEILGLVFKMGPQLLRVEHLGLELLQTRLTDRASSHGPHGILHTVSESGQLLHRDGIIVDGASSSYIAP